MNVLFDKSFNKSVLKLKNPIVAQDVIYVIAHVEGATALSDIKSIKKLSGHKDYYRIRIGDYRIGLRLTESNVLKFIVVAHRKDIYNVFP